MTKTFNNHYKDIINHDKTSEHTMKQKIYRKPTMKVLELKPQSHILALSGGDI